MIQIKVYNQAWESVGWRSPSARHGGADLWIHFNPTLLLWQRTPSWSAPHPSEFPGRAWRSRSVINSQPSYTEQAQLFVLVCLAKTRTPISSVSSCNWRGTHQTDMSVAHSLESYSGHQCLPTDNWYISSVSSAERENCLSDPFSRSMMSSVYEVNSSGVSINPCGTLQRTGIL